MKLDRTFYHSWYLVVLGSLCPLVKADTTVGWLDTSVQDDGSGELEQDFGNSTSNIQVTGGQNGTQETQHNAQDNQIDDHQDILLPTDHFILEYK